MDTRAIIIAVGSLAVVLLLWYASSKKRENFKVLGALAPYRDLYYRCTSECEKSDPGKQLYPTKGSMMCQEYCDSSITELSRKGGPSYPVDSPVDSTESIPTTSTGSGVDDAYKVCGDGSKNEWCRNLYTTYHEIDSKCRMDCEYSTLPTKVCMERCTKANSGNASLGWSWK